MDRAAVRKKLMEDLDSVLKRYGKIDAHLHNTDREVPQDWSDRAQMMENDEVLEALGDHGRAEVAALRSALHRLDEGSYGICANCGEDVGEGRLSALPSATLCIECAS